jgi:choline-glycine betaine transporter
MINIAIVRTIAIALVGILFVITVLFGVRSGVRRAQSYAVLDTVAQVKQAVDYFYSDNNRYPSAVEFNAASSMGTYLQPFPAHEFRSAGCQQSITYRYTNQQQYQLDYCIPSDVQDSTAGTHTLPKN